MLINQFTIYKNFTISMLESLSGEIKLNIFFYKFSGLLKATIAPLLTIVYIFILYEPYKLLTENYYSVEKIPTKYLFKHFTYAYNTTMNYFLPYLSQGLEVSS